MGICAEECIDENAYCTTYITQLLPTLSIGDHNDHICDIYFFKLELSKKRGVYLTSLPKKRFRK